METFYQCFWYTSSVSWSSPLVCRTFALLRLKEKGPQSSSSAYWPNLNSACLGQHHQVTSWLDKVMSCKMLMSCRSKWQVQTTFCISFYSRQLLLGNYHRQTSCADKFSSASSRTEAITNANSCVSYTRTCSYTFCTICTFCAPSWLSGTKLYQKYREYLGTWKLLSSLYHHVVCLTLWRYTLSTSYRICRWNDDNIWREKAKIILNSSKC